MLGNDKVNLPFSGGWNDSRLQLGLVRPLPVMPLSYERSLTRNEPKIIAYDLHLTVRSTAVVLDVVHEPIQGAGLVPGVALHAACLRLQRKGSTYGRRADEFRAQARRPSKT